MAIEYRGYVIQRDPQHTLFHIHSQSGTLPKMLTGLFTSERAYKSVIDAYLSEQEHAEAERASLEAAVKASIAEQVRSDAEKFEVLKEQAKEINRQRKETKE